MANKKLKLVQTPATPEKHTPIIPTSTQIVWHPQVNGLDCYGHSSQELLDVADKVYALYNQTPTIQLSGDVLIGGKIIRINYETATYNDVTNDAWHLTYVNVDVEPINGTFAKARVGVNKIEALEKWEQSPARQAHRAKLFTTMKLA